MSKRHAAESNLRQNGRSSSARQRKRRKHGGDSNMLQAHTPNEGNLLRIIRAQGREIRKHISIGIDLVNENRELRNELKKVGPIPETVDLTDESNDLDNNEINEEQTRSTTTVTNIISTTSTNTTTTTTTSSNSGGGGISNNNGGGSSTNSLPGIDVKLERHGIGLDMDQLAEFHSGIHNLDNRFRLHFNHCVWENSHSRGIGLKTLLSENYNAAVEQKTSTVNYNCATLIANQALDSTYMFDNELGLLPEQVEHPWNTSYVASTAGLPAAGASSFHISFRSHYSLHLFVCKKLENGLLKPKLKFESPCPPPYFISHGNDNNDAFTTYEFTAYMNTRMLYYRKLNTEGIIDSVKVEPGDTFVVYCSDTKSLHLNSVSNGFPLLASLTPIIRLSDSIVVAEIVDDDNEECGTGSYFSSRPSCARI